MLNSLDVQERTIRAKKETFKQIWGSEIKVWLASSCSTVLDLGKTCKWKVDGDGSLIQKRKIRRTSPVLH
jgi:hypothetical protein